MKKDGVLPSYLSRRQLLKGSERQRATSRCLGRHRRGTDRQRHGILLSETAEACRGWFFRRAVSQPRHGSYNPIVGIGHPQHHRPHGQPSTSHSVWLYSAAHEVKLDSRKAEVQLSTGPCGSAALAISSIAATSFRSAWERAKAGITKNKARR